MIQDPRVIAAIEVARKLEHLPTVEEQVESLKLAKELIYDAMGVLSWHWLTDGEYFRQVFEPLGKSHEAIILLRRGLAPEKVWAEFEKAILTLDFVESKEAFLTQARAKWPERITLRERAR